MNTGQMNGIKKTVLVVDDEDTLRNLIKKALQTAGYHIITAENGQIALDKLAVHNVDLVLLDIKMPVLDGYRTLEIIRKGSNIPVIMLTAFTDSKAMEKAVELGADGYIYKPFSPAELVAQVGAKLKRTQSY